MIGVEGAEAFQARIKNAYNAHKEKQKGNSLKSNKKKASMNHRMETMEGIVIRMAKEQQILQARFDALVNVLTKQKLSEEE